MTTFKQPKQRRILTPTEREKLKDEMSRNEAEMRGEIEGGMSPAQRAAIYDISRRDGSLEARNRRIKHVLANGEPEDLGKGAKVALEARRRELETFLVKRMVPKSATALRPGPDPRFRKAVNMMAKNENSPEFSKAATEWKNTMRTLDPHDPNVANLENIRPHTE